MPSYFHFSPGGPWFLLVSRLLVSRLPVWIGGRYPVPPAVPKQAVTGQRGVRLEASIILAGGFPPGTASGLRLPASAVDAHQHEAPHSPRYQARWMAGCTLLSCTYSHGSSASRSRDQSSTSSRKVVKAQIRRRSPLHLESLRPGRVRIHRLLRQTGQPAPGMPADPAAPWSCTLTL